MNQFLRNGTWAVGVVGVLITGTVISQTPKPPDQATKSTPQQDLLASYRRCPNGYYSGPQPGKTRFTQDPWVWAVSPQFAVDYCMPPEFISRDLKGAEAIAYKMMRNDDEIICGWGDKVEICDASYEHRFEIYYRTGEIPKEVDLPYYQAARLPSKMLISQNDFGMSLSLRRSGELKRPGTVGVFSIHQFGLLSVRNNRLDRPLGGIFLRTYFQEVFPGLDFIALEGGSGFTRDVSWIKNGSRQFVITARKAPDPSPSKYENRMSFDEFSLVIALPTRISESMIKNDQAKGIDVIGLARRALSASDPSR